jgi:hypothetical protein
MRHEKTIRVRLRELIRRIVPVCLAAWESTLELERFPVVCATNSHKAKTSLWRPEV